MSLDADTIVDRRRMRRKLTFWRVFAVLLAICAVVAVGAALRAPGTGMLTGQAGASIARVTITGLIRTDRQRVEAFETLAKSPAKAVIVHINSPGGTTSGSEELYDSLMRLKVEKPTVVVVDGLAASGGYIAAIAADHIVAQETALVGSIGVLFQYPNFTEALKSLGIKVEEIKSSPLKAAPNGFEPTSPEARAAIEAIVLDSYAWFRNLVKSRRNLDVCPEGPRVLTGGGVSKRPRRPPRRPHSASKASGVQGRGPALKRPMLCVTWIRCFHSRA
jgi:protease-4